jgi:two-component system nitrate/nitrite response regulator NarL
MSLASICLAHSQQVFVNGLAAGLTKRSFHVVKKTTNGMKALRFIMESRPAIAMLGAELPMLTAFDIMKTASEKQIPTKFILIFPHRHYPITTTASAVKISGILYAGDDLKTISECITSVLDGNTYFSEKLSQSLMPGDTTVRQKIDSLSDTEKKLLLLVAKELPSGEIMERLGLQSSVLEDHITNLLSKLTGTNDEINLKDWISENKHVIEEISVRSST